MLFQIITETLSINKINIMRYQRYPYSAYHCLCKGCLQIDFPFLSGISTTKHPDLKSKIFLGILNSIFISLSHGQKGVPKSSSINLSSWYFMGMGYNKSMQKILEYFSRSSLTSANYVRCQRWQMTDISGINMGVYRSVFANLVEKWNWLDHYVRNKSKYTPLAYFPFYIFLEFPLQNKNAWRQKLTWLNTPKKIALTF